MAVRPAVIMTPVTYAGNRFKSGTRDTDFNRTTQNMRIYPDFFFFFLNFLRQILLPLHLIKLNCLPIYSSLFIVQCCRCGCRPAATAIFKIFFCSLSKIRAKVWFTFWVTHAHTHTKWLNEQGRQPEMRKAVPASGDWSVAGGFGVSSLNIVSFRRWRHEIHFPNVSSVLKTVLI